MYLVLVANRFKLLRHVTCHYEFQPPIIALSMYKGLCHHVKSKKRLCHCLDFRGLGLYNYGVADFTLYGILSEL